MTIVQRLVRRNVLLGGLALLLLLVLVFRPSPTSALRTAELPRLFPDLEVDAARTIVIERAAKEAAAEPESLRLVRAGEASWQVASRGDYPASAERVRAFLEGLEGAREKKVVTQRQETFGEYAGPNGWTKVQVLDATGKPLASFELGKPAVWPDSYVKTSHDGVERILRAHNLIGDKIGLDVDEWVEARLWPRLSLPLVTGVDVAQRPAKKTISFKRRQPTPEETAGGEGGGGSDATYWEMVAPKTATASRLEVEELIRAFTGMRLDDVIGAATDPEAEALYGFDRPTYRVVVYAEGGADKKESKAVLEVGLPSKGDLESPESFYVRRGGDTWVLEVPAYAITQFERAPEDFLPKEEPSPEDPTTAPDEAPPTPGNATGDPDGTPPTPGDANGDPDGTPSGN